MVRRRFPPPAAAAAAATTNLGQFARLAADRLRKVSLPRPDPNDPMASANAARRGTGGADPSTTGRVVTEGGAEGRGERLPLSEVVADCVRRWFQDTLKEARAGDVAMQVLVGQMYYSGYGISRNVQKGKAWISKASRHRPSALKVGDKRPGYNVSDSDSDDLNDEAQ